MLSLILVELSLEVSVGISGGRERRDEERRGMRVCRFAGEEEDEEGELEWSEDEERLEGFI